MAIKDIILLVLTNSAITAVLLAAVGFIGKSFIEQMLNKNLERYKVEVQKTIKYNEKRLEVIDHLYRSFINYSKHMNAITHGLLDYKGKGHSLEKGEDFSTILNDLEERHGDKNSALLGIEIWHYYSENCLYLNDDLSKKIHKLMIDVFVLQSVLASATDFENQDIPLDLKEVLLMMKDVDHIEIARELHSNFNKVLRDLEIEFRKQLA